MLFLSSQNGDRAAPKDNHIASEFASCCRYLVKQIAPDGEA